MKTNWYGEPVSAVRSSWLAIERMAPRRLRGDKETVATMFGVPKIGRPSKREEITSNVDEVCYA